MQKIIDDGGCFIIEVEDGSDQKNPYRTGRYCAIKKEAAKKLFGQEHSIVYMEKSAYSQIIPQNKERYVYKRRAIIHMEKVYEMIDRLEDGEYICVALRNVVFMYFKTHKNIYEFRSDETVRIYFPELEEKISMATEPEETRTFYGWFGCISPETKEVRLNIVKDIIKELE